MFKAIKDNKIIAINNEEIKGGLIFDEMVEDTEHTVADYEQYEGEYLLKSEIPAPTLEEQKAKRAQAYLIEKDPITCQIQSLKDEEQTPEIIEEIESLKLKRAEIVSEIKERYPYPEETEEAV